MGRCRRRLGVAPPRRPAPGLEQGSQGRGGDPAPPVAAIDPVGDLPLGRRAEDRRVTGHWRSAELTGQLTVLPGRAIRLRGPYANRS